jgi:apolipoprotein N-acyltransferase
MREWLRLLSLPNTDLVSGEQIQPLINFNNNVSLAVAICYEIAFGAQQLYAFPEAGLLINVSNDAWFGDSIAPHQHLQLSRMRSLEVGREMVRVTNDGISAFIDSKGKVVKQSDQFVFYKLATFAQPRKGATPYVLFGNWPILILNSLLLIVFFKRKILRNEKL